jgi:hypothetical protein
MLNEYSTEKEILEYIEKESYYFLQRFKYIPWAQPYLNSAAKLASEEDSYYFFKSFYKEQWASSYLKDIAKKIAEEYSYDFLILYHFDKEFLYLTVGGFLIEECRNIAAANSSRSASAAFVRMFINQSWAQPYLNVAIKNIADSHPKYYIEKISHLYPEHLIDALYNINKI